MLSSFWIKLRGLVMVLPFRELINSIITKYKKL